MFARHCVHNAYTIKKQIHKTYPIQSYPIFCKGQGAQMPQSDTCVWICYPILHFKIQIESKLTTSQILFYKLKLLQQNDLHTTLQQDLVVYRVDFPWAGWCRWSSHGSSACRRTSQGYQNCWYSSARHPRSTLRRLSSIRRRPVPDLWCPRYTSEHNWRHTAAGSLYWASEGALVGWKEHKNRDEVFNLLCI